LQPALRLPTYRPAPTRPVRRVRPLTKPLTPVEPCSPAARYRRLAWLTPLPLAALAIQLYVLWGASGHLAALGFIADTPLGHAIWWAVNLLAASSSAILAWRFWLMARYRPVDSVSDAELPTVTVVVPAFNEGRQVMRTLVGLAASDYPAEKLEIIAVDDGSQDDTWQWMREAADRSDGAITAIRCAENRGKRHALYEGFRRAGGAVLITVDSDSEVNRDTLRNMASPFVRDARVGAVAGNVRVLNRGGILAKMLDTVFTYSFDFLRASQSVVGCVMCTPGALSAYRRSIVDKVLDEWLGQRFLGREARIGEDRAMTNLILRAGYHTTFQGNAIVRTEVPVKFSKLCRMFMRWARSNIRETLVCSRFMLSRFRKASAAGARINLVHHAIRIAFGVLLWAPTTVLVLAHLDTMIAPVVIGSLAATFAPFVVVGLLRSWASAVWALAYGPYSAIALSWITTYAMLTLANNGWMTRAVCDVPGAARLPAVRSS
jgi:hyaluronan synthase